MTMISKVSAFAVSDEVRRKALTPRMAEILAGEAGIAGKRHVARAVLSRSFRVEDVELCLDDALHAAERLTYARAA